MDLLHPIWLTWFSQFGPAETNVDISWEMSPFKSYGAERKYKFPVHNNNMQVPIIWSNQCYGDCLCWWLGPTINYCIKSTKSKDAYIFAPLAAAAAASVHCGARLRLRTLGRKSPESLEVHSEDAPPKVPPAFRKSPESEPLLRSIRIEIRFEHCCDVHDKPHPLIN